MSSGLLDVKKYVFDAARGLVDKSTSSPYDGPEPVIVLTVDGGMVNDLKSFTPLLGQGGVIPGEHPLSEFAP